MKKLALLAFLFLSFPALAKLTWLPVGVRLEGIGAAGGVAALYKGDWTIAGAIAGGDVTGGGVLASKVFGDYKFSVAAGGASNVNIVTTYERGLTDDVAYQQELTGYGVILGLERRFFSEKFITALGLGLTSVQINSFSDTDGNEIDLGGANLFPINTLLVAPKFVLDLTSGKPAEKSGFDLSYRPSLQMGRAGQADTLIETWQARYYQPIFSKLRLAVRAVKSSSQVFATKDKYDTDAEIRAELNANCGGDARCTQLEDDLVQQILAENTVGSAVPLGGSNSVRGFREFRFRGAHTASANAELLWNLGWKDLHLGMFADFGYAADSESDLFKKEVRSHGAEFIFFLGDQSLRLGAAEADDGNNAWYLTLGSVF